MTHVFSKGMEEIIRGATGMSVDEIRRADSDMVHRSIENKIGHKLQFGYEPGLVPRNVLLAEGRIIRPEELNPPAVFVATIKLVWVYAAAPFKRVFWTMVQKLIKKCVESVLR